jgi:hypothetical protein
LEKNKIIYHVQYGFRKKLGTGDASIDINNFIHNKRDDKKKYYLRSWIWKKAFDSISRQVLLNKLKELGFDENTIKWFISYSVTENY